MRTEIHIMPLSKSCVAIVESAASLLNATQHEFEFRCCPACGNAPDLDLRSHVSVDGVPDGYSWKALESFLAIMRGSIGARYLIAVTDRFLENNWFSRVDIPSSISFITTHNWELLSSIPVSAFVAYQIARNAALLLFEGELRHEQTRGCISDLCAMKPDMNIKIRTADICPECVEVLSQRLSESQIQALISMLEEIRLHALGRKQAARSHDATQSRSDAQYPFPVAFCRRSMLLETSPHRRWEKMIDLAELVMKYVTIGAIASAKSEQKKRPFIARLTRSKGPSMRDWYECCFAALDPHAKDACSEFCLRHARSIPEKTLERAHGECSILVKDRNQSRGHGHIMEELAYQGLCSKHTRTIDSLLGILDAFSECELLKPQDLRCRERITKFSAQVLMGSHPLFAIREYTVQTGIDTDCILHDRERNEFISLYPWIHLEHCEACMRPMMFIFHRYAPGNLELLEYPNNHSKSWKEDIAE